jgi:hypothetical protein
MHELHIWRRQTEIIVTKEPDTIGEWCQWPDRNFYNALIVKATQCVLVCNDQQYNKHRVQTIKVNEKSADIPLDASSTFEWKVSIQAFRKLTWMPRIPNMMKNIQQIRTMLPIGRNEDSKVWTTSFKPGARLITLKWNLVIVPYVRFILYRQCE